MAPMPPEGGDAAPATSTTQQTPASRPSCPIPAPSHPLQFRAIGLVRGRYVRAEKINQGTLVIDDDSQTEIDAVLLGRTIGVVKNHVDLDKSHLWVVYPRTRPKEQTLQLQIVGIWEPETLNPDHLPAEEESEEDDTSIASETDTDTPDSEDSGEETTETNGDEAPEALAEVASTDPEAATEATDPEAAKPKLIPPVPRPPVAPPPSAAPSRPQPPRTVALPEAGGEFSIRGEVVFYSEDAQKVVVKIKQSARQEGDRPKFFKLEMQGKLPSNRALRQFWDLLVRLEGETLTVLDAASVAPMKPKKRPRPEKPVRGKKVITPPQRAGGAPAPQSEGQRERPRPKRNVDRPRPQKRDS